MLKVLCVAPLAHLQSYLVYHSLPDLPYTMFFSSALPLAVLAATSALATPIQQAASLSSSSPPENPQSQNTLKPFVLESLKTSLRDGRQLIMFWVQDPAFGSFSRGTCMAIVDGVDGEQLGPDTDEERQWRPVRPSPEDDAAGPVSGSNGLPFPANEYNMDQDRYEPDSVMGEDGFIDCSNGFSFKTEGDVAFAENGSNQFKLSVKHKLDRENSNGLFRDGE